MPSLDTLNQAAETRPKNGTTRRGNKLNSPTYRTSGDLGPLSRNSKLKEWIDQTPWPPANAKWLESEPMRAFQAMYREYRLGWAKGAKGEVTGLGGLAHASTFTLEKPLKRKRHRGNSINREQTTTASDTTSSGAAAGGNTNLDANKSSPKLTNDEVESWESSSSCYDDEDVNDQDVITDEHGYPIGILYENESIFQDTSDPQLMTVLRQLDQYRANYRKFRSGASRGAEGEIFKLAGTFTKDQLRLLPVAQLARCLADRVRDRLPPRDPAFHVHIGAGRLGCGLVIPAMVRSGIPFAVLQNIAEEWVCVWETKEPYLQMYINDEFLCRLRVIRSMEDLIETGWMDMSVPGAPRFVPPPKVEVEKCRLLCLNTDLNSIFLEIGDAFSCALGPAIVPVAKFIERALPTNSGLDRPALYCCENDHNAVDSVRPALESKVNVRECMVDRICSDRIVTTTEVRVTAEPYEGEIVVTDRYSHSVKAAFAGPTVRTPRTSGAYAYLYSRKFLLVNGTHTTLAFLTLYRCCEEPQLAPGDYELLDPLNLDPAEKEELRAWTVARCLLLLHAHELEVVKTAHGVSDETELADQLWSYAERVMCRFSTVKDSTKRVLGGGVTNRYETRLRHVADTLETFDGRVPLKDMLLKKAGIASITDLKRILATLVDRAHVFAYPKLIKVDDSFLDAAFKYKFELRKEFPKILDGRCTPIVTNCIMKALRAAGREKIDAVLLAKGFYRIKCSHCNNGVVDQKNIPPLSDTTLETEGTVGVAEIGENTPCSKLSTSSSNSATVSQLDNATVLTPCECVKDVTLKPSSPLIIASTDPKLIHFIRKHRPGTPILTFFRNCPVLEGPSPATLKDQARREQEKLLIVKKPIVEEEVTNLKVKAPKRKRPSGPNPLSCRPSKKKKGLQSKRS